MFFMFINKCQKEILGCDPPSSHVCDFSFPLACFFLVTFPRNLAQIFRSDKSTCLWNIFFHSFYTFEVMTHFVVEESFLNNYLATLFGYNSWDLNTVAFFSAEHF